MSFRSFFGALTCVAWSPDGKFIVVHCLLRCVDQGAFPAAHQGWYAREGAGGRAQTGGEDDLVSVWAVAEQRLVVRCQGHQSWVRHEGRSARHAQWPALTKQLPSPGTNPDRGRGV